MSKNDLSCVMINVPPEVAKAIASFADKIPKKMLAEDGIEEESHITVKYGFVSDDAGEATECLRTEPPVKFKLGKTSVFPASESKTSRGGAGAADVLKINVDSLDLHRINGSLSAKIPHVDSFSQYQPHLTIAYLKPGRGKLFSGRTILGATGKTLSAEEAIFSDRENERTKIQFEGTLPSPYHKYLRKQRENNQ